MLVPPNKRFSDVLRLAAVEAVRIVDCRVNVVEESLRAIILLAALRRGARLEEAFVLVCKLEEEEGGEVSSGLDCSFGEEDPGGGEPAVAARSRRLIGLAMSTKVDRNVNNGPDALGSGRRVGKQLREV